MGNNEFSGKGELRQIGFKSRRRYFDGANFASRITCPVRVAVGFSDTTCPPCAVYAAYNEIKSADKGIVHGIGMTHSCSASFYKELGNWVKQLPQKPVAHVQTTTDAWAKCVPAFNRLNDELYANAVSDSASEEHAMASIARSIR